MAVAERLGNRYAEAQFLAVLAHQFRAAGAAIAERDVEADADMAHA